MSRDWREEYLGALYHVIARGNNKEYIFRESIDKGYFIKLLRENSPIMEYEIYGYVFMDNHYHIIIQTNREKLQKIMHQINNKYSKYFNRKYKRVGHVFQGRYKAALIQDERYILNLLRYIHRNPVRAGLCTKVEDYRWSSDINYRKNIRSFINTDLVLEMLDKNSEAAVSKYKELTEAEEKTKYSELNAIGDEAYKILCESRKAIKQRKRLDEILIETGISIDNYQMIKSGARKRILTQFKIRYALEAKEQHYSLTEIGQHIGITAVAVKDMLNRYGF